MAKQIIVLDRLNSPSDSNFRIVFWVSVPTARQTFYANPNFESAFLTIDKVNDLPLLQNGSIVEMVESLFFPIGTSLAAIQANLISRFNQHQSDINNNNPYVRYGTFYDGTSWTAGGVA